MNAFNVITSAFGLAMLGMYLSFRTLRWAESRICDFAGFAAGMLAIMSLWGSLMLLIGCAIGLVGVLLGAPML